MANSRLLPLLHSEISHPLPTGSHVKTTQVSIVRRPLFTRATIIEPVKGVADLYWGRHDGDNRDCRFFAHPSFQDAQAESALLMHWRATLQPECFGLDFSCAAQRSGDR